MCLNFTSAPRGRDDVFLVEKVGPSGVRHYYSVSVVGRQSLSADVIPAPVKKANHSFSYVSHSVNIRI